MSERKHADLWNKLDDEAGENEIDRAASVSVEQAKADLKAAGFDVAAEGEKANAFLDALESGSARSAALRATPHVTPRAGRAADDPRSRRARSRPSFAWLAAAATLGAVAGGVLVAARPHREIVSAPPAPAPSMAVVPSAADLVAAADLRRKATDACDATQWSLCLADLDKARAADPGGDDAPAVKSLRDRAIAGITQETVGVPPH